MSVDISLYLLSFIPIHSFHSIHIFNCNTTRKIILIHDVQLPPTHYLVTLTNDTADKWIFSLVFRHTLSSNLILNSEPQRLKQVNKLGSIDLSAIMTLPIFFFQRFIKGATIFHVECISTSWPNIPPKSHPVQPTVSSYSPTFVDNSILHVYPSDKSGTYSIAPHGYDVACMIHKSNVHRWL